VGGIRKIILKPRLHYAQFLVRHTDKIGTRTTFLVLGLPIFIIITRKYMHAETLADKTIVFSEREVFKVVVMVTQ
jgi:hypothetical protein